MLNIQRFSTNLIWNRILPILKHNFRTLCGENIKKVTSKKSNSLKEIPSFEHLLLLNHKLTTNTTNKANFSTSKDDPTKGKKDEPKKEEENVPPKPKRKGRHEYHDETEQIINCQIFHEFNASYIYLAMSAFFGRTDVAFPGCQGYFFNMHLEEHEHACIFLNFQLMRGGHVKLMSLPEPPTDYKGIVKAFTAALETEVFVKERLTEVFQVAEKHKDLQVQDLITTDFMDEQNKSICEIARLLERAKMATNPIGEYLFDKMLFNSFVKKSYNKLMHKRTIEDKDYEAVYK